MDHFRSFAAGDQPYQPVTDSISGHNVKRTPDAGITGCQQDSSADPVDFAGSQILSAIGRHGLTEDAEHDHEDFRDLAGCRMGNDNILSQLIDGGLQCQCTDIDQRAHESHGKTGA